MAAGYRRGTEAADGPQTLGVVGGVRKDQAGTLAPADGTYAEMQLDEAGNLRVSLGEADALTLREILGVLVAIDEKLALLLGD